MLRREVGQLHSDGGLHLLPGSDTAVRHRGLWLPGDADVHPEQHMGIVRGNGDVPVRAGHQPAVHGRVRQLRRIPDVQHELCLGNVYAALISLQRRATERVWQLRHRDVPLQRVGLVPELRRVRSRSDPALLARLWHRRGVSERVAAVHRAVRLQFYL